MDANCLPLLQRLDICYIPFMPNYNPKPIPDNLRHKIKPLAPLEDGKKVSPKYQIRLPQDLYDWCVKAGPEYIRGVLTRAMKRNKA